MPEREVDALRKAVQAARYLSATPGAVPQQADEAQQEAQRQEREAAARRLAEEARRGRR